MAYFDNINPTIYELVSDQAERILELGCGAGALASALKNKCKKLNYYIGIELDEQQAILAKPHTTETFIRNLDAIPNWDEDEKLSLFAQPGSFDHIIMGDVLEHLFYPLTSLRQAVGRLRSGGIAIACIPNAQHWTVFANLARGTWPTDDSGLFDRTHIRWFTLDDMMRLFMEAGLKVEQVIPRCIDSEQGLSIMEDLEPLARNIGADPEVLIARGQVLQFVLVGRKS